MPSSSGISLIKGYMPVRVGLPPTISKSASREDTFLFAKEHRSSGGGNSNKSNRTLFIANCPFFPNVRTSLLLKSIFSRYGDVERVTVVRNPRDVANASSMSLDEGEGSNDGSDEPVAAADNADVSVKLFDDQMMHFSDPYHINYIDRNNQGKFAHVVFESNKDMKRAVKTLGKLMAGDQGGKEDDDLPFAVELGALEIQELAETSAKLLRKEQGEDGTEFDEDEDDDSASDDAPNGKKKKKKVKSGIYALAERQRSLYVKRRKLLEACNAIMEQYEDAEEEAEARARASAAQPDDDGFVTVVASTAPAMGADFEGDNVGGGDSNGGRRKGTKRKRKQKKALGASELKDFYRFQTKETRKKGLQELRERFEADLAKVKKLKEEKAYRAF